jgi:hypothetical protein
MQVIKKGPGALRVAELFNVNVRIVILGKVYT